MLILKRLPLIHIQMVKNNETIDNDEEKDNEKETEKETDNEKLNMKDNDEEIE